MLALNAKEYLQHRTPTAWLEALSLQHELEVMAECMFLGVAYNRQLGPRFEELKADVILASDWLAAHEQASAELNSRITILGRMAAQFKAFNQIDEELACLNEVRMLHPNLWRTGRLRSLNSDGTGRTVAQRLVSALGRCAIGGGLGGLSVRCIFHEWPQSRILVPLRLDLRPWDRLRDHPTP